MNKVRAFLYLVGTTILGTLAVWFAAVSAGLRKSQARETAERIAKQVESAKAAEELRAKVAQAKADKAQAEADKEKQRDTVDVANGLIAGLSAGADKPAGEG